MNPKTNTNYICSQICASLRAKGIKPGEAFRKAGLDTAVPSYFSIMLRYKHVQAMAEMAGVSVTALISGLTQDSEYSKPLHIAVMDSITHAGKSVCDYIRTAGYFSKGAMISGLKYGNITIKNLLRISNSLGISLQQLITDCGCYDARDKNAPQVDNYDLRRMGWLTPTHYT